LVSEVCYCTRDIIAIHTETRDIIAIHTETRDIIAIHTGTRDIIAIHTETRDIIAIHTETMLKIIVSLITIGQNLLVLSTCWIAVKYKNRYRTLYVSLHRFRFNGCFPHN